VDLIEAHVDDRPGVLQLHSFYVRYLLPMMLEVQFFDWAPEVATLRPAASPAAAAG
jgi:hypothetical protein